MKSKKILLTLSFLFINSIGFCQQIGNGYAPTISDFSVPLLSGVYSGLNADGSPSDNTYGGWKHLFVIRHNADSNNHQLQLSSSYVNTDRLFFRKIATGLNSENSTWFELATRGVNTFNGNQIVNGNVGIGITTPSAKLETFNSTAGITSFKTIGINGYLLVDNVGSGENYYNANNFHEFQIGGVSKMRIQQNGDVGIGTTSPTNALTVQKVSGGAGFSGTDGTGGVRVNWSSGYGVALDAWDGNEPRWGITKFSGNTPTVILEGKYNSKDAYFNSGGNIGIGTTAPDEKLTVKGKIHAQEVRVDLQGACAPDYVFQKYYTGKSTLKSDYVMPTLAEIESFTKKNHHLPNVPSAQEVQQNGVSLGTMSNVLLQKVEELTLYAIEQNKELERLKTENNMQSKEIKTLKKENEIFINLSKRLAEIENQLK